MEPLFVIAMSVTAKMTLGKILGALGVIGIGAGIALKPREASVEWSPLWGLATNSSPVGKVVFVAGMGLAVVGAQLWLKAH